MLTYNLFRTQSMLMSETGCIGWPDVDLHPVENTEHGLVSNNYKGLPRCWLTCCSKPKTCSCQQQAGKSSRCWLTTWEKPISCSCWEEAGRVSQMLTYTLLKTQSMLLSATSRRGQPDADLHSIWNPEHALVSNRQKRADRCWLTRCSKPKACSYQQQTGKVS